MGPTHGPRLVLGPVLFLWEAPAWRDFYFRMADEADVDCVVLGEVVCSKRQHFHEPMLEAVVERLKGAGKAVRLASLTLVTNEREIRSTRQLCAREVNEVEAEDLSAHHLLRGRPHAIGRRSQPQSPEHDARSRGRPQHDGGRDRWPAGGGIRKRHGRGLSCGAPPC